MKVIFSPYPHQHVLFFWFINNSCSDRYEVNTVKKFYTTFDFVYLPNLSLKDNKKRGPWKSHKRKITPPQAYPLHTIRHEFGDNWAEYGIIILTFCNTSWAITRALNSNIYTLDIKIMVVQEYSTYLVIWDRRSFISFKQMVWYFSKKISSSCGSHHYKGM